MLEFIIARYNYWIVIILMLSGLYTVFSRGNLVKTVIGLNVFQTSVFIFYITLGKVMGGTAPILPYKKEGHGEDEGHGAAAAGHGATAHPQAEAAGGHQTESAEPHDAPDAGHGPMSEDEAEAYLRGDEANALDANTPGEAGDYEAPGSLHDMPELDSSNALNAPPPESLPESAAAQDGISITEGSDTAVTDAAQAANEAAAHGAAQGADAAHGAADILYSNPLPHVLILTAIVVGVATTAVGLALAVRIREAYGTIEEDALEKIDNEAATGSPYGEGGSS